MRTGFFTTAAGLLTFAFVEMVVGETPTGVLPKNTENMTSYYDTSTLATNGVNIAKANTTIAPTVALDKVLNGTTFAVIMFDPDTPATGIGGNGTNSFVHWFQDGLTSSVVATKVGGTNGKEVFNLVNVGNKTAATAAYVAPGPPKGETHRYTQILVDTTGMKAFNVSRTAFDPNAFVTSKGLKVRSSNFFNVTGV